MHSLQFCIVGYGDHAKRKILPGLKNIDAEFIGIVTSKEEKDSTTTYFNNLDDALINLDNDCVFIICSPPHIHFKQSKKIINAGFDLFIEKPITLNTIDIIELINLSKKNKIFFVENFMHKYSLFYKNFIDFCEQKKGLITSIEIKFLIPTLNIKTFRNSNNINYSVNIYDIGCYITSLLNDLSERAVINILEISLRFFSWGKH